VVTNIGIIAMYAYKKNWIMCVHWLAATALIFTVTAIGDI